MKNVPVILFMSMIALGCQQEKIIGIWRRAESTSKLPNTSNPQPGDIIIRSDSTFLMQGDTIVETSSIPGWYAGESFKGNWDQRRKGYIFFWLDPKETKMVLGYEIIDLKKRKLVLRPPYIRQGDKQNYLKYIKQ